jgi:hypothetical protein
MAYEPPKLKRRFETKKVFMIHQEKFIVIPAINKFATLFTTTRFITVFTKLPPMNPVLSQYNPIHRHALFLKDWLYMGIPRELSGQFKAKNLHHNS